MPGFSVADAFVAVRADLKQYDADLKKAEASGTASGSRLANALKRDFGQALGAGVTLMFAAATAGATQLANAAARVRAETGAGVAESEAAAKAINRIAGSEMMAFGDVEEIALRVRRDMGLAGKAADDMTARMAKFARVTRQDGAAAVADFDDIIDRWNLNASDTAEIQNVLIAGWQQWGGDITANQQALAKLAPQLQAMNMTWQDGAALINLFNAAGVDAASQTRALTTAFKNLKAGETLPGVIAELSAMEDPAKRATRAIEIFGQRGGQELATALGPGVGMLSDYAENVDGLPDKVDGMASDLDSTWTGKLKKFFSEASAAVKDFGFNLGEAGTAAAGFASLVATLGGGKLLKGLAKALVLPFLGLGKTIAVNVATEFAASGIAGKIGYALTGAVNKLPGVPALKTGLGKAGAFMGSTLGKAIGIAAGAAAVLWFVDELGKRQADVAAKGAEIAGDVANQVAAGTTAQLEQSAAALKSGIDAIVASTNRGPITMATPEQIDALKALVAQYNVVQTELNRRAALAAAVTASQLRAAQPGVASASRDLVGEIPTAFEKGQAFAAARVREFLKLSIGQQLVAMGATVIRMAGELALGIASGLRDKRSAIDAAIDQLKTDLKNRMSPKKEVAHDIGLLFGKTLARGLHSADPIVKAQAQGTRALIEAELIETIKKGGEAGDKIQDELEKRLHSKDPKVKAQAVRTKSLIDAALAAQPPTSPGDAIGDQLNADLKNKNSALGKTAYDLGRTIYKNLVAGVKGTGYSAPRPPGVPHQVPIDSFDMGTSYVPHDMLAYIHKGEMIHTPAESDLIRKRLGSGPLIGELNVDARGHPDAAGVGDAVKRAVGDAMASVFRDQSARGLTGVR